MVGGFAVFSSWEKKVYSSRTYRKYLYVLVRASWLSSSSSSHRSGVLWVPPPRFSMPTVRWFWRSLCSRSFSFCLLIGFLFFTQGDRAGGALHGVRLPAGREGPRKPAQGQPGTTMKPTEAVFVFCCVVLSLFCLLFFFLCVVCRSSWYFQPSLQELAFVLRLGGRVDSLNKPRGNRSLFFWLLFCFFGCFCLFLWVTRGCHSC